MIDYSLERARRAVQYLVDSSYFHHHVKKLRNTVGRPRSMPFKDEAEPLNELLVVGRQNRQAMENLIAVAEQKRGGKTEYQREYMAAKRRRDRKVLQLEALLIGKDLSPQQKKNVLDRQYAVWNKERDQMLDAHQDQSWTARNEMIRDFWQQKEEELEALTDEARDRAPPRRRRSASAATR
jgi:hypothetical protein